MDHAHVRETLLICDSHRVHPFQPGCWCGKKSTAEKSYPRINAPTGHSQKSRITPRTEIGFPDEMAIRATTARRDETDHRHKPPRVFESLMRPRKLIKFQSREIFLRNRKRNLILNRSVAPKNQAAYECRLQRQYQRSTINFWNQLAHQTHSTIQQGLFD